MLRTMRWVAPAAVAVLALTACSSGTTEETVESADITAQVDAALAELEGQVLAKGPHGEDPEPASVADLTDAEVAEVADLGATAAIVLHYGGNDWANAQVAGLEERFAELGIEIVASADVEVMTTDRPRS